jgi:hypothetical protein
MSVRQPPAMLGPACRVRTRDACPACRVRTRDACPACRVRTRDACRAGRVRPAEAWPASRIRTPVQQLRAARAGSPWEEVEKALRLGDRGRVPRPAQTGVTAAIRVVRGLCLRLKPHDSLAFSLRNPSPRRPSACPEPCNFAGTMRTHRLQVVKTTRRERSNDALSTRILRGR